MVPKMRWSAWCCQWGHTDWDPTVAPIPLLECDHKADSLLMNLGSSHWRWACRGLMSLLITSLMPDPLEDFFFKCSVPKTISQVLILVLAFIPEGFKASLREHPFHFSLIPYCIECSDIFPLSYSLSHHMLKIFRNVPFLQHLLLLDFNAVLMHLP